jgi:hypothetical protein
MPPPMQQFPAPPPLGFLPEPLEQKVYTIFRRMMPEFDAALLAAVKAAQLADTVPLTEEAEKILDLDAWLKIRGVIEAFRLMATGVAGQAPPTPGAAPAPALPAGGPPQPAGPPAGGPPPPRP